VKFIEFYSIRVDQVKNRDIHEELSLNLTIYFELKKYMLLYHSILYKQQPRYLMYIVELQLGYILHDRALTPLQSHISDASSYFRTITSNIIYGNCHLPAQGLNPMYSNLK